MHFIAGRGTHACPSYQCHVDRLSDGSRSGSRSSRNPCCEPSAPSGCTNLQAKGLNVWCVPCGLCARLRGTPALAHEDDPLGRLLCVPPRQFTSCRGLQAIRAHVVGRAGVMSRLFLQPERSRQSRMQPQNGRQRVGTARSRWSQGGPRVPAGHARPPLPPLQRCKFVRGVNLQTAVRSSGLQVRAQTPQQTAAKT